MEKIKGGSFGEVVEKVINKKNDIPVEYFEDEKDMIPLWFTDAVREGNRLWFSGTDFNGLFKGNISTGEVELIDIFESEDVVGDWLHFKNEKIGNKIYFFPDNGNVISVFDIESNKITKKIDIPFTHKTIKKVVFSYVVDEQIYLFGHDMDIFMLKTKENDNIEFCEELSNILKKVISGKFNNVQVCIANKIIYFPIYKGNEVVEIDLVKGNVKIHIIKSEINLYGCHYFDGFFWLTGINKIIKCDNYFTVIENFEIKDTNIIFDFQFIRDNKTEIVFFDNKNKGKMIWKKTDGEWYYEFLQRKRQNIKSRWNNCVVFGNNEMHDYYFDMDNYALKNIKDNTVEVRFLINKNIIINKLCERKMSLISNVNMMVYEDDKINSLQFWIECLKNRS